MNPQFLFTLGAFGIVVYLLLCFIQWIRSPLRWVSGPTLARFTNVWYLLRVKEGGFEKVNLALHEKYGPIVRYGPKRYSFSGFEASKTIYGHGTQFQKSDWYSTWELSEAQWNLFSDRSTKRHSHNKRLYSNAFSMTSVVHYEPYLDECGDLFTQRLLEFSKNGTSFDLGHWFQCFAFDAIAYVTYGQRMGFLDKGDDIENVIKNIDKGLVYSSLIGIFPVIHQFILPILIKLIPSIASSNAMSYVQDFTERQIIKARSSAKSNDPLDVDNEKGSTAQTFLSKFLARNSEAPDSFTDYHILIGCGMNMGAGSDTTGISLSAIMYYLLKNSDCMKRLQAEVDEVDRRGELSTNPSLKEGQKLPYLQAVIKEALRMHPATGLPMERIVPKGGATIAGRFFPAGSIVGINSWVQHQNKALFGQDAGQFRPERWLIDDEDQLSIMNRNWMPFGLGARTCIGKNVSILEMTKLIPRIVREFDFQLEGDAATTHGCWTTHNMWFVKPRGFHVTVRARKNLVESMKLQDD